MCLENPLWGAPRIHGEFLKLGFEISQSTVSKHMPRRPRDPDQCWKAFLRNHMDCTASIDFLVVPTITFKVLFVLIVLSHERRRVMHFGVTANPTNSGMDGSADNRGLCMGHGTEVSHSRSAPHL